MGKNLQLNLRSCLFALACFSFALNISVLQSTQADSTHYEPLTDKAPAIEATVGAIVIKLVERNRQRDARMRETSYTGPRIYRVKDEKGNVLSEARVLMNHRAPGSKEFKILSQIGSSLIFGRVIKPLMEHEVEAATGLSKTDNAITPANYTFELLGEEQVSGIRCFVLQATPKRLDKFLFRGRIWIHIAEFAVVKIAGQPAKTPSMLVKRVDFIRRYHKVGEFWLPSQDDSTTQVRFGGTNFLSIDYVSYDLNSSGKLAQD